MNCKNEDGIGSLLQAACVRDFKGFCPSVFGNENDMRVLRCGVFELGVNWVRGWL